MKKNKLLSAILPLSIIGSSIVSLTNCGNKGQKIITKMSLDDSAVKRENIKSVDDQTTTSAYVDYTNFAVNKGFDINNIKVVADWKTEEFSGIITTKLIKVDDEHFSVRVLFQTELMPLIYDLIKFDLIFTNKIDTENTHTTSLSASFIYGDISVTSDLEHEQKLTTIKTSTEFVLKGEFKAYKTINLTTEQISDFSNFSVAVTAMGWTSMYIKAEIVPHIDKTFLIKLSLNNIEEIEDLPIILTFTNKMLPEWSQYISFSLTISSEGAFSFDWYTQEKTATITGCNLSDDIIQIPETTKYKGEIYKINGLSEDAFNNCTTLKTLIVSQNLTKIENDNQSPFRGTSIEKIVVNENNQTFTSRDVDGKECNCIMKKQTNANGPTQLCYGCAKTTIPNTITNIDVRAFEGNLALEIINIPDSVKTISKQAFNECQLLKQTNWTEKSGLTEIGYGAFCDCSKLESATLPNNLLALKELAYTGSGIKSIYVPKTVNEINFSAFYGCEQLEDIKVQDGNQKWTSKDSAGIECKCIMNKQYKIIRGCRATIFSKDSKEIQDYAFFDSNVVDITMPSWITKISSNAFARSCNLKSIKFDETSKLDSIGEYAFEYCLHLETVILPQQLITISSHLFTRCDSLKEMSIPASIKVIESGAFHKSGLAEFILPNNSQLSLIRDSAFDSCENLKEIDLSKATNLEIVNSGVFANCISLESIKLSPNIETIGDSCFSNDTSLKKVIMPSSLKTLGHSTFKGCTSLTSVEFANTALTELNNNLFENCTSLVDVTLPNGLTSIYQNVFASTRITSITIPASVKLIDKNAFHEVPLVNAHFDNIENWVYEDETTPVPISGTDFAANAKILKSGKKIMKKIEG